MKSPAEARRPDALRRVPMLRIRAKIRAIALRKEAQACRSGLESRPKPLKPRSRTHAEPATRAKGTSTERGAKKEKRI